MTWKTKLNNMWGAGIAPQCGIPDVYIATDREGITLSIDTGNEDAQIDITPQEARKLAALLIEAVDWYEKRKP